ncbi:MAG TPA: DUF4870 domain-containing protein [Steroidobacteraceae bacterium]|jgi:uncharacterized protein|nr:DUF4870 domain-containing protein [Steroidobacteraceae bacterium]
MEQPVSSAAGTPSKEQRNWAMLAHLSALLVYPTLIGGIVGPLVIWLIRKDDMPFAADQAKETLNFQITVYLAGIVCLILTLLVIGIFLGAILVIAHLVLTIVGAIKASEGVAYRYPFNLRLIS